MKIMCNVHVLPHCESCIGHFGKYHNALGLSPQILFQEKLETMLMQNLKEQPKSIMVFSEVAYTR